MNTTKRELTDDLLTFLDEKINSGRKSDSPPALSNYQLETSRCNLNQVINDEGAIFIEAGSNCGGFNQYFYYKNKDNDIYLMDFYAQEFQNYYKITGDNNVWHKMVNITENQYPDV